MRNKYQPAGRRPSKLAAALQNAVTRIHSVLYRASNGVIGGRIANSPVLIVPCLYLEDLDRYPDAARQQAEVTMAVQSIGAAIQNLLLSAYSLGLDTGWMCAPLFCPDVVQAALDLPGVLIPHALINLGYGAKDPPRRPHRLVGDLIIRYE